MRTTIKIYITALVGLLVFGACDDANKFSADDKGSAYIYAEIAGQKDALSRGAATDIENGTYTAFSEGDEIGLYALGPLYNKSGSNDTQVKNTRFKLGTNGRWQVDAQLIWNSEPESLGTVPADIYGYYPYKQHNDPDNVFRDSGYGIFKEANKLEDVLMAERTTVQYDNPAIFLTFRHRFALLKIKLGTGMEGSPTVAGAVSAVMNLGIENDARIDNMELGQMRLTEKAEGVKEFKPVKTSNGFYYIIVPVEGPAETDPEGHFVSDSLQVTAIKVDGQSFALDNIFAPRMNTIYSLTVHKGNEGSVSIAMGGIEEWGSDRYLSNVREEGGIYWASDLKGLQNALNAIAAQNRAPAKSDESTLSAYGKWDDDLNCFVFPVMRNINMNDYANENRSCCIENFYGVLDGRGRIITGLDITGPGLIGTLKEGAIVKDLELKNTTVNNGSSNTGTGALVGRAEEGSTIHNCSVTGTSAVKGGNNTGGLVGCGNPTMDRCSSNADVEGGSDTGGLIGSLTAGGKIDRSVTTGTVTAITGDRVGGLAGSAAGPITNSHAGCDVTGKNNVGGLVGSTTDSIDGCTATGYIKGEDIVGGLAGTTKSTVGKSGANGTVTGTGIVGGLIGKHDISGDSVVQITGSYARSTIIGGSPTGGLIGTTTRPYQPDVYEIPQPTVEDPDPEPVLKTPARGTELKNCYATNGKVLVSNSDQGISYSYQIGSTANDGGSDAFYTISLPLPDEASLDLVIAALNAGSTTKPWVKGMVIIDSKSYTLPVLNYK